MLRKISPVSLHTVAAHLFPGFEAFVYALLHCATSEQRALFKIRPLRERKGFGRLLIVLLLKDEKLHFR